MNRRATGMTLVAVLVVLASPARTQAQPSGLFIDTFSGPVLHPRWVQPPPSDWRFGLINDRLEVYRVGPRFQPPPLSTQVSLFANVNAVATELRVVLGLDGVPTGVPPDWPLVWGAGVGTMGVSIAYASPASMWLRLAAGGAGLAAELRAAPGVRYDCVVRETDGRTTFIVNGVVVGDHAVGFARFATQAVMSFTGPRGEEIGAAMWIDEIAVIPAPGTATILFGAACLAGRRRR